LLTVVLTTVQAGLDGQAWPMEDLSRFIDDADFTYQYVGNTSVGNSTGRVQTFCTGDFSWEHHGYSLSCHLYMDVGVLLDDEFRTAKNLTYNRYEIRHTKSNSIPCVHPPDFPPYLYCLGNSASMFPLSFSMHLVRGAEGCPE